jgi:anti-sigma factor (TIGR02949 family)
MSHEEMQLQVDAYLDGELAPQDARELELHLEQCGECATLRDSRIELSTAVRRELPEFTAPEELRSRVREAIRSAAGAPAVRRSSPRPLWRWGALAASLLLAAVGGWRLGSRGAADSSLTEQILASHIRSLMPGHLTDVLSSDRHTVKPWFNGKLDYSPPVYDFAGKGFPLIGGRLDYINGRSVAVLVYQSGRHLINVFLWPSAGSASGERAPVTRLGFHILGWTAPGYICWMISDLGTADLTQFAGLWRDAAASAAPWRQ